MTTIEIKNVKRTVGRKEILNIDHLEFGEGINLVLGPNGSGKSTMLKIISGVLGDFKGEVLIDGKNIREDHIAISKKLGTLIENPSLYRYVTAEDMISFAYRMKFGRKPAGSDLEGICKKMRLESFLGTRIGNLSSGERKRLSIGIAIVSNPELLVLDEPEESVDYSGRKYITSLIETLHGERINTVVLSTHELQYAAEIGTRAIFLKNGKIALDVEVGRQNYYLSIRGEQKSLNSLIQVFPAVNELKTSVTLNLKNKNDEVDVLAYIRENKLKIDSWKRISELEYIYLSIYGETSEKGDFTV